jgi:hypothetical protein
MPKFSSKNTILNKKDSGTSGENPPGCKKPVQNVKRGGGHHHHDDDDESVDSHGNIRGLISYSDEDEESMSMSSDEKPVKKKGSAKKSFVPIGKRTRASKKIATEDKSVATSPVASKKVVAASPKKSSRRVEEEEMEIEEEEEEEEEEDDDDEDYDDDDEDYETDEEEEEWGRKGKRNAAEISISFGGMADSQQERMVPKRHNMKKENEITNKFVKLITEPRESGGIDEQIEQFKALPSDKQKQLVASLERRPSVAEENMMFKILTMNLSPETQSIVLAKYNALQSMDPSAGEYYKHRAWLEKLTSLPLESRPLP